MLHCELVPNHDNPVILEFDIDQFKDNKGRWFDFIHRTGRESSQLVVTFGPEGDMYVECLTQRDLFEAMLMMIDVNLD